MLIYFNKSAFFEQDFDVRALDFLHNEFQCLFFRERKFYVGYGLFVYRVVARSQQFADIVFVLQT